MLAVIINILHAIVFGLVPGLAVGNTKGKMYYQIADSVTAFIQDVINMSHYITKLVSSYKKTQ